MRSIARMLDANGNRAREALRTLEDIARFALDDADICALLKSIRHDTAAVLRSCGAASELLLAARDTLADVGTSLSTPSELERPDLRAVAAAAAARAGEALRVIEECAKTTGGESAKAEAARYTLYTVERDLLLRLAGGGRQWRLCVLVTEALCKQGRWEDVAEGAIEGGAECLQLREKSLPDRELLRRARRLVELAHGRAAVVINDRADIAWLARADGVHLGQDDLSPADARRVAGERLCVGVSVSTVDRALAAVRAGASVCGVGAMFASSTKAKPQTAGPGLLRAYLADQRTAAVPHLAIGGITPENIGRVREAGALGVAVSSAVCGAEDPAATCRALLAGLEHGSDARPAPGSGDRPSGPAAGTVPA